MLSRIYIKNAIGVLIVMCTLFLGLTHVTEAEEISLYGVDIDVNADGSFLVTENIEYNFRNKSKYGIYREIPKLHPQKSNIFFTERYIDILDFKARKDGEDTLVRLEEDRSTFRAYIGDPELSVTGKHVYQISYKVEGGLTYVPTENLVEIYWNAIGSQWNIPILNSKVRVTSEDGILLEEKSCFVGQVAGNQSCVIVYDDLGAIFTSGALFPTQGMTIANTIDPSKVSVLELERLNIIKTILVLFGIWLISLLYWAFGYKTQHKVYKAKVVEYEPYKDFKPMLAGILRDGILHPQDITAGILYLAQKGFIKIHAVKQKILFLSLDDHEVELLQPFSKVKGHFDVQLLKLFFRESDVVGKKVSLMKLRFNTSKKTENSYTLRDIQKEATEELIEDGYFETHTPRQVWIGVAAVTVLPILLFIIGIITSSHIVFYSALFSLSWGIVWLFVYKRRTKIGYEARAHIDGFEDFLSVTGKERFEFHNDPKKNPAQFLEYLPHAVALGVEEEWAEVFKDIKITNPDWYVGNDTSFSASSFADGIGSFSAAISSSSMNSSSGSTSSGGGSVGGGAGGGGGGSW